MASIKENADSIDGMDIQDGSIYSVNSSFERIENKTQEVGLTDRPLIEIGEKQNQLIKDPDFNISY